MKYTVDYFIRKFEAIPNHNWLMSSWGYGDDHCANGHCGIGIANCMLIEHGTEDAIAFNSLFDNVEIKYKEGYGYRHFWWGKTAAINDGFAIKYTQKTPKQRILAALRDIKAMQQPQHTDITKSLAILPPEETPDVKQIKQLS